MNVSYSRALDYNFAKEYIIKNRDNNKLLTLELELTKKCNYKCKYCYSKAGSMDNDELTFEELCDVISQAREMGVQLIVLIGGGETLLYYNLKELIKFIFQNQIAMVLFTNGSLLNMDWVEYFASYDVFTVLKVNGFNPKTVNWLCGNPSAYKNIINALHCLQQINSEEGFGVSTVICKQNINEVIPLWRWCRSNKLIPYFERLSPQGRAIDYDLQLTLEELKLLFETLAKIDANEYGIIWDSVHPPIAGMSCNRHYYSIYMKSNGDLIPCAGIDCCIGNIRKNSLFDIIMNSPIIDQLRHIETNISGKCRTCDNNFNCYGCRGNAYQVYKDYLSEDPFCWKGK